MNQHSASIYPDDDVRHGSELAMPMNGSHTAPMGQLISRFKRSRSNLTRSSLSMQPIPVSSPETTLSAVRAGGAADGRGGANAPTARPARHRTNSSSLVKGTAAAVRAIDERNVRKLRKVLSRYGYKGWLEVPDCGSTSSVSSNTPGRNDAAENEIGNMDGPGTDVSELQHQQLATLRLIPSANATTPINLLEYAVEKNFTMGVELLIQVLQ